MRSWGQMSLAAGVCNKEPCDGFTPRDHVDRRLQKQRHTDRSLWRPWHAVAGNVNCVHSHAWSFLITVVPLYCDATNFVCLAYQTPHYYAIPPVLRARGYILDRLLRFNISRTRYSRLSSLLLTEISNVPMCPLLNGKIVHQHPNA